MSFLTWDNQADTDTSIAAVNTVYGCPVAPGLTMVIWDTATKSDAEEKWGFEKPQSREGKTVEELEAVLVAGYTELAEKPSDWVNAGE